MNELLKLRRKIEKNINHHRHTEKVSYYLAQQNALKWAFQSGIDFAIEVCKADAKRLFIYSEADKQRKKGLLDLAKKLKTLNA